MAPGTYWVLTREMTLEEVAAAAIIVVVIIVMMMLLVLGIANGLLIDPVGVPHQHLKVCMSKIGPINSPSVVGGPQDGHQDPSPRIPALCGVLSH